jgi:hypothetical protein
MGSTKCNGDGIFIKETKQTKPNTGPILIEERYSIGIKYRILLIHSGSYFLQVLFRNLLYKVLRIRIRDPESGAFLTPGSGMGKKSGSESVMNNPDHISECFELIFWG